MGVNLLSCVKNIFPVFCYEEEDRLSKHAEDDRLSSLPDDLIHKILSFIGIKDAIKTSGLSSRWRYIWTSMPCLNFSCRDIHTSLTPTQFIMGVFGHRNYLIGLSSIKLTCGRIPSIIVETVLKYALCNNVQQLTLESFRRENIKFPVSVFSSESLKHLTLRGFGIQFNTPASTWELLALTTLHLDNVTFYTDDKCIDLFSKCVDLKNLTLNCCRVSGLEGFRICHPYLSNLTITDRSWKFFKHLHFSTDTLNSLEKLHLVIDIPCIEDASKIFDLLQHLHGVKFLTLNLELVEFLSSSMKLIPFPPSPFAQLKTLKIYPGFGYKSRRQRPSPLSTEIKNYFLNNSPSASFTLIPHKGKLNSCLSLQMEQVKAKTCGIFF